ncbi:site-specific integrase [Kitasatospora sp. NPDC048343]|uniref:site-specific integrase n=1 Tax=Kitasatospora sp. NPDC048343 TaxID=3154717 RepID=UPI0033DE042E
MPALGGWEDLEERESRAGIRPGTPILLSPSRQIDGRLSQFLARSSFARLEPETKRNYTTDYCVFFDFLWSREKSWDEATPGDLWDFEDWRVRSMRNPQRVGGARWNRGLAALGRLYSWAVKQGHVPSSPIETRQGIGRHGQVVRVPAARAKDSRASNVRWLTPRTFRRWVDVGLRGFPADGAPDTAPAGRLADRNSAFANLLFSSGVRLTEGASLLTLEIPRLALRERRYYASRLAPVVTKSKRARTESVAIRLKQSTVIAPGCQERSPRRSSGCFDHAARAGLPPHRRPFSLRIRARSRRWASSTSGWRALALRQRR